MFNQDDNDEIIGYLEEQGAITWDGMDKDGEAIFKFNLNRLKEVMPELHEEILKDIDKDLMILYQEGFVELEYDEELNAKFKITEKVIKWAEDMGFPPFPN
jgi:hypothetical protein